MKIINKTHLEIDMKAEKVARMINSDFNASNNVCIYGYPRGGIPPMYLVYGHLQRMMTSLNIQIVENIENADVIIDDLIDSGNTEELIKEKFPNAKFYALFRKTDSEEWFNFPWENGIESTVEDIVARISQVSGASMEDTKIYLDRFMQEYSGISN